jgi:hypothetical protein
VQALPRLLSAQGPRHAFVQAGGLAALLAALPPPPPAGAAPAPEQDPGFVMVGEAAVAAAAPPPAPAAPPAAPEALAALEALALVLGDAECKEAAVAAGAPPRLVALLRGADVAVLRGALAALAAAADHPVARQDVRWGGGRGAAALRAAWVSSAAVAGPGGPRY